MPGLRIVAPATIDDARGMLRPALASPDPVIVFEPISLYNMEGGLTEAAGNVRLEGAAEELAKEGIEAEIIDLRSLRPLDDRTILESVCRTRRVVIVDEGWRTGGLSAEIAMRIVEQGFYDLDAPVARVCTEEVPIPYPRHLEEAALPGPARIVATVQRLLRDAR